MARIIYNGLVDKIQGSIGNLTLQRGHFGNVARNKPFSSKAATDSQTFYRSFIMQIITAWQGLNNSQRAQWNSFPSYAQKFAKNSPTVLLQGYQLFLSHNFLLLCAGESIITTITYQANAYQNPECDLYVGAGSFGGDFTVQPDWTNWSLILKATPPLRKTQLYYPKFLRILGFELVESFEIEFYDTYLAKFGSIPGGVTYAAFTFQLINKFMPIAQAPYLQLYNL